MYIIYNCLYICIKILSYILYALIYIYICICIYSCIFICTLYIFGNICLLFILIYCCLLGDKQTKIQTILDLCFVYLCIAW